MNEKALKVLSLTKASFKVTKNTDGLLTWF